MLQVFANGWTHILNHNGVFLDNSLNNCIFSASEEIFYFFVNMVFDFWFYSKINFDRLIVPPAPHDRRLLEFCNKISRINSIAASAFAHEYRSRSAPGPLWILRNGNESSFSIFSWRWWFLSKVAIFALCQWVGFPHWWRSFPLSLHLQQTSSWWNQ